MKVKLILIMLLLSSAMLISGCSTAKGLATGIGATTVGVTEDAKNFWQAMLKADEWMKENLW